MYDEWLLFIIHTYSLVTEIAVFATLFFSGGVILIIIIPRNVYCADMPKTISKRKCDKPDLRKRIIRFLSQCGQDKKQWKGYLSKMYCRISILITLFCF